MWSSPMLNNKNAIKERPDFKSYSSHLSAAWRMKPLNIKHEWSLDPNLSYFLFSSPSVHFQTCFGWLAERPRLPLLWIFITVRKIRRLVSSGDRTLDTEVILLRGPSNRRVLSILRLSLDVTFHPVSPEEFFLISEPSEQGERVDE